MAPAALLVCSVVSSRWPVSAALTPMFGGLGVAGLADHDHVGVVADDRAQHAREVELDVGPHLDLGDAVDLVLDRVLDADQLVAGLVEVAQGGVERRGLAAAGRAGDQEHAVRRRQRVQEARRQLGPEAEIGEIAALGALVQDADDQALAVHRGRRGDAQVDPAPEQGEPRAAVLRQPALGDVELGQDLDARDHRRRQASRRRARLAQPAMDPVAHAQMVARGLDMDVRGVQPQRVGQQLVDQPDHRRLLGGADQVLDVGAELAQQVLADIVDDPLQGRLAGIPVAGVGLLQVLQRGDHRHDPALHGEPDRLDRVAVARVGHGQPDGVVGGAHRQDRGVAQEAGRDPVGQQRLARHVVGPTSSNS